VESPVGLVDLPPTLLDAAGVDVPASMEGRSAMDLVAAERDGGDPAWRDDVFVQLSESEVGRALRTDRWKYSVYDPDGDGWEESASDRYVERFLYDLDADPYEQENLAGRLEYADVAERLRERLAERIREVEGAEPTIEPASHYP
jgi:arylsulfatase A-like enzyme